MKKIYSDIKFILGDQLNAKHSWYKKKSSSTLFVIAELHQEAHYTAHHIQKIAAFFVSMQNFAEALSKAGHEVLHLTLDDTKPYETLPDLAQYLCKKYKADRFHYQQPDEFRLSKQLEDLALTTSSGEAIDTEKHCSEHFLLPFDDFSKYMKADKHNRMESFYRKMRKRFDILMIKDEPEGGSWNYDANNRASFKKNDIANIPEPLVFVNKIEPIVDRIEKHHIKTIGRHQDTLLWPTSRKQSLELLDYFCTYCLPLFGTFQDAMTSKSEYKWSLYHSRISFSLNSKMLHPNEVIERAIRAYRDADNKISIEQIEGFVRQILGWREYVRAVYWLNMPAYATKNALEATRELPSFFWTGKTKMACMRNAIDQSLDTAYAHHIQRLMITGNFSLLAGIAPDEVDAWYLGIYIDAIEWVEMPNTRGMSLFADGGLIATKPYAASGNYINKMSDYCKDCHYSVKEKITDDACPFNSLYWHFVDKNKARFANNPRMSMVYRNFNKQNDETQAATLDRAKWCLEHIETL